MTEAQLTWGAALLLLVLAVLLSWKSLRLLWLARLRQRLITAYGVARLDNVILEDGLGGHKVLEHVLLTADGLQVLLPRHCEGDLFGGDKIDTWTLIADGRSSHLANPLYQLEELLATLRYNLPGIPLEGQVLLSGSCRFPKGRPSQLLLLDEMPRQKQAVGQAVVPVLQQAWQKLQAQPRAKASEPVYAVSPVRLWLSALIVLLTLGWLAMRLGLY